MVSLLLVIAVGMIAFYWARAARLNRIAWLKKLNLPGVWRADGSTGRLELSGNLMEGDYRLVEGEIDEHGKWKLEGHNLILSAGLHARKYDLRLFDQGKIGLDGPGLERRVFLKGIDNVVPLRRRN